MATNASITKSDEMNSDEMNSEEMKEYLEAKEMPERNKDKIKQDVAVLSFKYRQALKQTLPRR